MDAFPVRFVERSPESAFGEAFELFECLIGLESRFAEHRSFLCRSAFLDQGALYLDFRNADLR